MEIGFDRKTEEIQLFGKTFVLASLTINDLIALDLIDGKGLNIPEGHLNIHKMLVTISSALAVNYTKPKFDWNLFQYYAKKYSNRKVRKELSYEKLKEKLSLQNMIDLVKVIEKLNGFDGEKKKTE